MNNVANIKAYAANLSALVYMNKHYVVDEESTDGATILYRVSQNANGDFVIEGFRASMADGANKTFKGELEAGVLWAGSKRKVFDYLNAKDRQSTELTPLEMHFHESKFEEFFIAEHKPMSTLIITADVLSSEAVAV
jgi:hypothetical protein